MYYNVRRKILHTTLDLQRTALHWAASYGNLEHMRLHASSYQTGFQQRNSRQWGENSPSLGCQ